jgi:hypothetical protein
MRKMPRIVIATEHASMNKMRDVFLILELDQQRQEQPLLK